MLPVSLAHAETRYDLTDLTDFVSYWLDSECAEKFWCDGFDLDQSGNINLLDFGVVAAGWISDCAGDSDCDGLSDGDEGNYGTNPNNPDTDGDQVTDGDEVYLFLSDPTEQDTDGDGLLDGAETNPDNLQGSTISNLKDPNGNPVTSLTFSAGGKERVYAFVPVRDNLLEYIGRATLTLTGQTDGGNYPSDVLLDVGADWIVYFSKLIDWHKPIINMSQGPAVRCRRCGRRMGLVRPSSC